MPAPRVAVHERKVPAEVPHISRQEAWQVVVANERLIRAIVNGLCQRLTANQGRLFGLSADELFDEAISAAYERAMRAVELFDPGHGVRLSTYIGKAAARAAGDAIEEVLRQRGNDFEPISWESVMSSDDFEFLVSDHQLTYAFEDAVIDQIDNERQLNKALAYLSPEERQLLEDIGAGKTQAQLADELGVSKSWVKRQVARARQKVRFGLESA